MICLCKWLLLQAVVGVVLPNGHSSLVTALPLPGNAMTSSSHRLRHRNGHRRPKQTEIELIKKDLIQKFGFDHVPDVSKFNKTVTVQEKRRKLKDYRKSLEEMKPDVHKLYAEDLMLPEIYHKIVDNGVRPAHLQELNTTGKVFLHFPVSIPLPNDPYKDIHVHSAKLKLNIVSVSTESFLNTNQLEDNVVRISVYQLIPHVLSGRQVTLRRLMDSRMVALESTGTLSFNVKDAVEEWLEDPVSNWGLEIVCDDDANDINKLFTFFLPKSEFEGSAELFEDYLPHINVLTQEREVLGRARRSDEVTNDCEDGETKCCRVPVVINFREIGWDFIVEPRQMTVYHCSGNCPNGYRPAHNFVSVQAILHRLNPRDVRAPCCAPSELVSSDLFLMYDQQGHLVEEQIDNFIVSSCKCT